jgi:predicted dienelactone hydrolase
MVRLGARDLCRVFAGLLLAAAAAGAAAQSTAPGDYQLGRLQLPAPGGRYAIGTRNLTIEVPEAAPLEVVVWYPAAAAGRKRARYFSDAERAIQKPSILRNFRWPPKLLDKVALEATHAFEDAPVARGKFPAVVFSHGYWSYPRQNTALMEALAAHGYVVFSLAHPGDAADLPTRGGTTATIPYDKAKTPDSTLLDAFWSGSTDAARRAAFPGFWAALEGGRLPASLKRWRSDIMRLTDAVSGARSAGLPSDLARAIDPHRLGFAGMSFGGSASASACERDRRCRASVNLDGLEFDRDLYDRGMRAPLLLIQSDWHAYPNAGPPNACFTAYDYAYKRWSGRGATAPVHRYAVRGARHMGMTDLILAPSDNVRDMLFGPADGRQVVSAVNAVVLAFLDRNLKGRRVSVAAAASRHRILERHVPFEKPAGCTARAQ